MRLHIKRTTNPRAKHPWQTSTPSGAIVGRDATLTAACRHARHLTLIDDLLTEAAEVPAEYHGVPACLLLGDTRMQKTAAIYAAAQQRKIKVDVHYEAADEPGDDLILATLRK